MTNPIEEHKKILELIGVPDFNFDDDNMSIKDIAFAPNMMALLLNLDCALSTIREGREVLYPEDEMRALEALENGSCELTNVMRLVQKVEYDSQPFTGEDMETLSTMASNIIAAHGLIMDAQHKLEAIKAANDSPAVHALVRVQQRDITIALEQMDSFVNTHCLSTEDLPAFFKRVQEVFEDFAAEENYKLRHRDPKYVEYLDLKYTDPDEKRAREVRKHLVEFVASAIVAAIIGGMNIMRGPANPPLNAPNVPNAPAQNQNVPAQVDAPAPPPPDIPNENAEREDTPEIKPRKKILETGPKVPGKREEEEEREQETRQGIAR